MAPAKVQKAHVKGGLSDMNLLKSYLTGHAKIAPTKDGKWTKADLESKEFKKFVEHLTPDSSVARRHPVMSLSVYAGMLTLAHADMAKLRGQKILGEGMDPDTLRTDDTVLAAVTEIVDWLETFLAKPLAKPWVMASLKAGDRLRHVAHGMGEWASAVSEPAAWAEAIPSYDQYAATELQAWKDASTVKKSKKAMLKYLTAGLMEKNGRTGGAASSSAAAADEAVDFASM
ncbi:unnamed protein product [Effrenium voratum]|nr:unnamed protein product [Effrenium voratum]